jgi:hypothetical protein
METLPQPEVIRRFTDHDGQTALPAMRLRWDPNVMGFGERLWYLPENVCVTSPAPERFGVCIERHGEDAYAVRLLWNRTHLSWSSLTRVQLLTSALSPLLAALGTDLWQLLSEPVHTTLRLPRVAA